MDPYGAGGARRGRGRNAAWALVVVTGLVFLHATMGDAQTPNVGAFATVGQLDPTVRGRVCDALRSVQARLASFPQATTVVAALLQSFGCSGPTTPGSSTTSTSVAPSTSTTGTGPPTASTTSTTLPPCIGDTSTTTVPCQPTSSTVFVPPTTSTTLGPGQTTTSTTLGFCTTTTSSGAPQTTVSLQTTTTAFPPTTIPCIARP
jgi:hypothetical protein